MRPVRRAGESPVDAWSIAMAICRTRSSVASHFASSGRFDSASSSGRRNPSICASGGRLTGAVAPLALSIGASVPVTTFGDAFDGEADRENHQIPPLRMTTRATAMMAIGLLSFMCGPFTVR